MYKVIPGLLLDLKHLIEYTSSANTWSLGVTEPMMDCVEPPFADGVTGRKIPKALRSLYISLQGVCFCVCVERVPVL